MEDADCLEEYLQKGSEAAFQALVQRHLDLVYATAYRRLANHALAEEAAQNVFITLARKAPALRGRLDLSGWLYKTTLLKSGELARHERRRMRRETEAALMANTSNERDSALKSLVADLDEAMLDLREKDRQALLLRFFENKPLREVGASLGVREDAAQKRVATALEALSRAFRKRGHAVCGTAAIIATIQEASWAAPAGLLAGISGKALGQVAAAASGVGFAALLAKLMSITKAQAAIVCLLIAATPAIWQSSSITKARHNEEALQQKIRSARTENDKLLARKKRSSRNLDLAREATARFQAGLARRAAYTSSSLYRWNEDSEYVRVPKALLSKMILAEASQVPDSQKSWEETDRPVMSKDGGISRSVTDALDLSTNQIAALQDCVGQFRRDFEAVARRHTVLTNAPPENLGFAAHGGPSGEIKTLYTTAFPKEGALLEQQFHEQVEAIMGSERAETFWQQARHDFAYFFNRFGKSAKAVTLVRYAPSTKQDSATFYSNAYQFYVRGQVESETEGESRKSFFWNEQPPAWTGLSPHRLLPLELEGWWPDREKLQSSIKE